MVASPAWLDRLLQYDERYRLTSQIFLRLLALIYLAAFLSTALEITGLVGARGILPAGQLLERRFENLGQLAWIRFPSVFWLSTSDAMLLGVSYLGCGLALLLLFNWRPGLMLVLLFGLYLSLFQVGQIFFNFQWEYLLLEAGFLSIFLVGGPNRLLVFLFHWLLFRLRFLSGVSKLSSEDPSWSGLTTLNYYFETQPLPHLGAWYAHQLPEWLLRTGTGFTLFVELVVPFFIFLPRRYRLFAAGATILIQLLIIASSNHNWVNLLTIALCLFLLDDKAVRWLMFWRKRDTPEPRECRGSLLQPVVALVLVTTSLFSAYEFLAKPAQRHGALSPVNWVRGWGLGNVYHIFPNMQTERHELIIQGSHDGREWKTYDFRYKTDYPGDEPVFAVPLHPRLDWLMWFLPPQNPYMRHWFEPLMMRLHQNEPTVTALLKHNPFADQAPRYLRVMAYRYRFTTQEQRRNTGMVWQAELLGQFPAVPPRNP